MDSNKEIRGYCSQCSGWCPTVSIVKNGVFVEVRPDRDHPLGHSLCPKGLAGPELVYNRQRLEYPMRRTRPKSDPDPGWQRITWGDALEIAAEKIQEVKATYGDEAIAVTRSGPAGSPMGELGLWVTRFANALGTPNNVATTHICQWHRDCGSAYTYGNIGRMHSAGRAEFDRSACILIWGSNIHSTRSSLLPFIKRGLDNGAKLIVIDPRRTEMIREDLYDLEFVRDWTTAPFLVRSDTGGFLMGDALAPGGDPSSYAMLQEGIGDPQPYFPGSPLTGRTLIEGTFHLKTSDGNEIQCRTVFDLLRESVSQYTLNETESITGIPRDKIREAARMFAKIKPACWYSWNGIEQNINATQTNRAVCVLYALTGNFDTPGGNAVLRGPAANPVIGHDMLSIEGDERRLGFGERPLGPCGTFKSTQAYEVYKAILTEKPYPVKGIIGFGGNIIMSNAPGRLAREALSRLDFHVESELFLSPAAELADIVLPAASSWESWHVGGNIGPSGDKGYIQLRPAVVPPQHESWPDMKIMFELAKRLGQGDAFWDGDIEAGFDYQFAPSNVTVAQLKANPGPVTIGLTQGYRKYAKKDDAGHFVGLPTPPKRVELYSIPFKERGHAPLPDWKEPLAVCFPGENIREKYPLLLINGKVVEYSHSQHRAIPSLRKRVPYPFLEINPKRARALGVQDGHAVLLETAHGSITLTAKITGDISPDVVCTQNGWWQACEALDLPGYDPYSSKGANVNLLYETKNIDPISGSLPIKGYPCRVKKV
jgi:anaerobic selenocysteine-containing dehydrogenase